VNGKNKILVVEDDKPNQLIYRRILSRNYEITICGDVAEFNAALSDNTYDLFIIDLALNSERNGIDLIKELRNISKYEKIPIVVITGHAFRKDKKNSMDAGATKFLIKPFNIEVLLAEIKECFDVVVNI
jgi:DNA-binding response OmpR family regulator